MRFVYGKQDMPTWERCREISVLLTNGLGGYLSVTGAFSVPRADQGILVAATGTPDRRISMVHRLSEVLRLEDRDEYLSTQTFADGRSPEDGFRNLTSFTYEYSPCWTYHVGGVRVERRCCMDWEKNTAAVLYTVENLSGSACELEITPALKFASKEVALQRLDRKFTYRAGKILSGEHCLYLHTDGKPERRPAKWQLLAYPEDEKDGRTERGLAATCCAVTKTVKPGKTERLQILFSLEEEVCDGWQLLAQMEARQRQLEESCGLSDPLARQLARSADAFIVRREDTAGKTILAGYPLFGDWGRDAMISLPGCCLATGRYDDAKSILRTYLSEEKEGLVPNFFPGGRKEPAYNSADAPLLLIGCVYQYVQRTGDRDFAAEAFPVLKRIVEAYRKGTRHAIKMDSDGLIQAGQGLDQVTWMDVRVEGILPTPRHGKPVEINAYWYNALRSMGEMDRLLGGTGKRYDSLAAKTKRSFCEKFYIKDKGYLKDVLCGTEAEEQLRCNQIWAVCQPFSMLTGAQERNVVDTVSRYLYNGCGLRTLSPEDPEYRGTYGGSQLKRDLAYHQGTTWVYLLGGYYLAYLKTRGYTPEAARTVREQLDVLIPMLRQGCTGQLPEIYDGYHPGPGKGCFAQAWSVGELLRVFEALAGIKE